MNIRPNGSGGLALMPELQARMSGQALQQKQALEAMLHCEQPLVLINSIYRESLGSVGVKLVLGEMPTATPGAPMKPRFAVALPWPIVLGLVKELALMAQQEGVVAADSDIEGAPV